MLVTSVPCGPMTTNCSQTCHLCLQSAVDAGAISARAKYDAAVKKAKALQAALTARGCVEEFEPDPALMAEGQVRGLMMRCRGAADWFGGLEYMLGAQSRLDRQEQRMQPKAQYEINHTWRLHSRQYGLWACIACTVNAVHPSVRLRGA